MTTTFDPAKTSATITLSGGNLTATTTGAPAGYASALSTSSFGSAKVYAEAKINNGVVDGGIGIANARPSDSDFMGFDNNSIAGFVNTGEVWLNNTNVVTFSPGPAAGEWIGIALDTVAHTLSFRNVTQGGSWSSGISISALGAGPLYFGFTGPTNGGATVNFDGAFLGAVPAGHARWDGTPLSPVFVTMPAAKGTLTLTRNDAVLKRTYVMPAAKGTLALTGIAAVTRRNVPLAAATLAVMLTGNAVNLIAAVARRMTAEPGAIALTGIAASLTRTTAYQMVAAAGALVLTGTDTVLRYARRLAADVATLLLTGMPASLVYQPAVAGGYTLIAAPGAIALTGNSVMLRVMRVSPAYEPVSSASLRNRKYIRTILR